MPLQLCIAVFQALLVPPAIAFPTKSLSYKEAIAQDDKPFSLKANSVDCKYSDRTEV
ncbi:hypothetical protein [Trichocoleus sp. DQ-U1]|uniref:hypothetical protein n=1 Tax=Trichocoleus sp. DQ-U1 TaxID=2933926 RepID=UPI00329964BE